MLIVVCVYLILWLQLAASQPSNGDPASARELDSRLQGYAFEAFVRPRTGIVYDGKVLPNLTGIEVAVLRLRSGSLRRRGVSVYKEFRIPTGVVEQPYVTRIALVYHNLGNWSSRYYALPGYTFLAPVLGLLAYDAADLSARNLSELDIRASGDLISVAFPAFRSGGNGSSPMCVNFGIDGSVAFETVVNGSTCLTANQGHFSIVVSSPVPPAPAPAPAPSGAGGIGGGGGGKESNRRVWIIAGSVIGGGALLVALSVLFVSVRQCSHRKKIRRMEIASEAGVPLPMTPVGSTKAPVAAETRTRPSLENEFVP